MDINKHLAKFKAKPIKNQYLHSPNHVLADELASKLADMKHFGFYLKMTYQYSHPLLHKILGEVLEQKQVDDKGKLFTYLINQTKNQ